MTASITILLLVIVLYVPYIWGIHRPRPSSSTHYLPTLPTTMMAAAAVVDIGSDTVYSTNKAATTVPTIAAGGYMEGGPGTLYKAQHTQVPIFVRGALVNGGECSVMQNTPRVSPW